MKPDLLQEAMTMALAQGGSRKETKPVGAGAAKKEEKDEHILRAQMALEHGLEDLKGHADTSNHELEHLARQTTEHSDAARRKFNEDSEERQATTFRIEGKVEEMRSLLQRAIMEEQQNPPLPAPGSLVGPPPPQQQ